jgi:RNA polymerase sigma-70 factor, ECF subfamily
MSGHGSATPPVNAPALAEVALPARVDTHQTFDAVYGAHFAFVWRNLRRLGVPEQNLRDAAQDTFLVVHRRLPEFEARAPLRSWLYSIVTRVARQHRRTLRRKGLRHVEDPDQLEGPRWLGPDRGAERGEALRVLLGLLDALDDDKREVFVLADLEGLSVPEIATAVGANANTVYSRLRAARQQIRTAWARGPDGRPS